MTMFPNFTPQLCLPRIAPILMLPAPKVSLEKPPRVRKPRPAPEPPRKFSGRIRLYWQEFNSKPDIIIEVHDPETYAALEILHGIYHLEHITRYQDHPDFQGFYDEVSAKCETYVDRIKRLRRLKVNSWDWDWAD